MLLTLENQLNKLSNLLGNVSAIICLLLLANVFIDVVMRYLFNDVSIAMQEMEWHLYSALFLLAIPYAIKADGHVRVDIFYEKLSRRRQAIINIAGCVIFLLPFTILIVYYGIPFSYEAYAIGEISGDPGGLPARWIIKGMIPLAMFFTTISGIAMIVHNINVLRGHHQQDEHQETII